MSIETQNKMMAVRLIVVSEELEAIQLLTTLADLQTLLQRALNTWSDIPTELLEFSDALDKI